VTEEEERRRRKRRKEEPMRRRNEARGDMADLATGEEEEACVWKRPARIRMTLCVSMYVK